VPGGGRPSPRAASAYQKPVQATFHDYDAGDKPDHDRDEHATPPRNGRELICW
jgi:hypothetical protein